MLPLLTTVLYLTATTISALPSSTDTKTPSLPTPTTATTEETLSGNQISLNGHIQPGTWFQQPGTSGSLRTHISDAALRQLTGVDLLDTDNPLRQPVRWFSPRTKPLVLSSLPKSGYRYLDITEFAQTVEWQMQANGDTLVISTPSAKVVDIHQGNQPLSESIVVDVDRPVPWQVIQEDTGTRGREDARTRGRGDTLNEGNVSARRKDWAIILDGIADPSLIQRYTPPTPIKPSSPNPPSASSSFSASPRLNVSASSPPSPIKLVEVVNNQTIIHLSVPVGLSPRLSSLANPNRLIIDPRADAMVQRSIAWAPGLRWRQQLVTLSQERFPVVWLEVNPRTYGIKLKPIWTNPNTLVGTSPLIETAQRYSAVAAINGGFFNRNNRLPLGAIRRDGEWLSSPILNRGAIAWNDAGEFHMARLTRQENLIGSNNLHLPISYLNSGYVQRGIARYTPFWGATYTSMTDNEIILVVQKNQVTNQLTALKAGETAVPIPLDGYLLTFRGKPADASKLAIGSSIRIISSTSPHDFSRYPYIVGAGPLLLQNRKIVLDAKTEQFSDAFITQKAIRSGICTTAKGTAIFAAVHNRAGGAGPTLAEHAQLMQLLGCVDALNLDGGSSTSLYLGGQLLDRSPSTAASVHNGIGIFLQPLR